MAERGEDIDGAFNYLHILFCMASTAETEDQLWKKMQESKLLAHYMERHCNNWKSAVTGHPALVGSECPVMTGA